MIDVSFNVKGYESIAKENYRHMISQVVTQERRKRQSQHTSGKCIFKQHYCRIQNYLL